MKAGDTIMFRGRRRFVVLDYPGGLNFERVQERKKKPWFTSLSNGHGSRHQNRVVYYSVSAAEKKSLRVVRRGTKRDVSWARKLLEDRCMPWTRIQWGSDGQPNYIHDLNGRRARVNGT
jgi:hypothetical protein